MNSKERTELSNHIRKYLESGKLTDESFSDLCLMRSALADPTIDGESLSRLKKYEGDEPGKGWPEVFAQMVN